MPRTLALALALAACGDGAPGIDAAPSPVCGEGPVTTTCRCGDAAVSSGSCCGQVPSTTACATTFLRTFHVSADGDDSADGLTPETAWRTLAKVSASIFLPGDGVLLRRGDTFRETLVVPSSGAKGLPLTFSSYGAGARPRVVGSVRATGWTDQGGDVWRSATTVEDPFASPEQAEVFFVRGDGSVGLGTHQGSAAALAAELDWTWDAGLISVHSTSSPETAYAAVEVPQRGSAIDLNNQEHLRIDGLDLRYVRWSGIGYDWQHNDILDLHGLTIEGCEIAYVGAWEPELEQGYGSEAVYSEMIIRDNVIHDCGRRGLAIDLYGDGFTAGGIVIEGNELYNGFHTTGVDIDVGAGGYTASLDGVTIRYNLLHETDPARVADASNLIFIQNNAPGITTVNNVVIYGNLFVHANGYGVLMGGADSVFVYNNTFYGHNLNQGWASHISVQSGSHAVVENNIFYTDPASSGSGGSLNLSGAASTLTADYNLYYNTNPYGGMVGNDTASYSMSDFADLVTELGWEAHSPTPADPAFIDAEAGDFHLGASSPARHAGTPISVVLNDRDGQPYDAAAPSIGAYEAP